MTKLEQLLELHKKSYTQIISIPIERRNKEEQDFSSWYENGHPEESKEIKKSLYLRNIFKFL